MGNSGKKMAEPGAPNVQKEGHSSEGVTGDATPKAPEQPVKYDDTNYKLRSWTDVQFDSYKKKKTVDFYGLVTVEAPAYEKENRPGIDCVCVLDVSGSMRGQKNQSRAKIDAPFSAKSWLKRSRLLRYV